MIIKPCEDSKLDDVTGYLNGKEVGMFLLSSRIEVYDFISHSYHKDNALKNELKPNVPNFEEFQNVTASASNTNAKKTQKSFQKKKKIPSSVPSIVPASKGRSRAFSEESQISFESSVFQRARTLSLDDLHQNKDYIIKRLVQLLNEMFPDYDFGLSKPTQYIMHTLPICIRTINSYLAECTVGDPQFLERMWRAIHEAIDINHCEIFSYKPADINDGPFADGLWAFNYFFYNEELKRVCFFFCKAQSLSVIQSEFTGGGGINCIYEEDEEEEGYGDFENEDYASEDDMDISNDDTDSNND